MLKLILRLLFLSGGAKLLMKIAERVSGTWEPSGHGVSVSGRC